jgi:hypothetical protein
MKDNKVLNKITDENELTLYRSNEEYKKLKHCYELISSK